MKANSKADPASLRQRALGYLARREHSRQELACKLEAAGFETEAIAPVLDSFEANGWLSDARFAESWIADHQARHGRTRLVFDLKQRGVAEAVIEAALCTRTDDEIERARAVWKKKFGTPPTDAASKARQIRFLQSRGFTAETIRQTLQRAGCEQPEISG